MAETSRKLEELKENFRLWRGKLQVESKRREAADLAGEVSRPGFWSDQKQATQKSRRLAHLQEEIKVTDGFNNRLAAVEELAQLEDAALVPDLLEEIEQLGGELHRMEVQTYLSGKYDNQPAILTIHAGQGGTEAMDWAQMLQRMYLRLAEKRGWPVDVVDEVAGEEAGVKSVTMTINGPYAYGYLKGERGTHRLVRQSPFNADKLRQTSFALVEVLPELEEAEEVDISDTDLEWEFFRASSHGGQNVQKVSTAVRLRHKPSGIVVASQSERYQERNREIALKLLRAKLWEVAEEKKRQERSDLKGDFKLASWGNQIRSYVLHPYKMVKDLRTDYEEGDPTAVLDGDLDGFLEAELKLLS